MTDDRKPLNSGDTISLSAKRWGEEELQFHILGTIRQGRSCFCYKALLDGVHGQLKEFYPVDFTSPEEKQYLALTRSDNNQIVPIGSSMTARFERMCQAYAESYETMARSEALQAIPAPHRLYHGSSVYVWTPENEDAHSFRQLTHRILAFPARYKVDQLRQMLQIIRGLTDRIRLLHNAGLLHLDISSDTLFITPTGIELRDADGIHSAQGGAIRMGGAEGFRAPEVELGLAENRSDIYSIGVLLYSAVIIPEDPDGPPYRDSMYRDIGKDIAQSLFLCSLKPKSHAFMRFKLEHILRQCLAVNPRHRYSCCEDLIADLDQLIEACIEA